MDRSFLSEASVVEASRSFVCIRLATYEDKAEAEFMESIYIGRSGQLENTTFAILAPNGKRQLTAAGRGPFHAFRGATNMAAGMKRIAAQHPGAEEAARTDIRLPLMKSLDLALNVAAADGLPLAVTVADSKEQLDRLNQSLVQVAWSPELAGQVVYASVVDIKELKPVTGVREGMGILVVEPDQFGLSGKVMAQFAPDESRETIRLALREVVENFPRKQLDPNLHTRLGIQLGIDWKSEIPETDPQSLRAKTRARGGR